MEPDSDVETLQKKIEEKFHVPKNKQLIKFKRDGFTLRVIAGWTLKFYEIKEKSIVYLEKLEATENAEETAKFEEIKMTGRYYAKLGILTTINDDDEDEEEKQPRKVSKTQSGDGKYGSGGNLSEHGSGEEDNISKLTPSRKPSKPDNKNREEAEKLVKEAKEGNLKKIKEILGSYTLTTNPQDLDNAKIKMVIDEKGNGGWNALHFSIFFGHLTVVKELLDKNADINNETSDGWTPLQLAIHKSQMEVAKLLLRVPQIKVNQVTSKGTALHVAAKSGKLELVSLLLAYRADVYAKNEEGNLAFEIASTPEIRSAIEHAAVAQNDRKPKEIDFQPPKPPIVKGCMYKKSGPFMMSLTLRYFVLNPEEGTFIRYRKTEDYPNKPLEIIPLKDISNVRRTNHGWFDKKDYFYLELHYTSRYIFATRSEEAINQWVKYIYQGAIYALFVEDKLKETVTKMAENFDNSMEQDMIQKNQECIEIIDTEVLTPINAQSSSSGTGAKSQEGSPSRVKLQKDGETGEIVLDVKAEDKALGPKGVRLKPQDIQDLEELNRFVDEKINFKSFDVLKILGQGAFGKVYKVRKRDTGKIYAMKQLKKRNLIMKNQLRYAVTECNVLKQASHPFILGLHYAFQTLNNLYLVLDYCPGADLSLHLAQRVTFEEDQARFYIFELIMAVEHLHSMNVIYRDLKPENILIAEDGHIKLADFGLAKEGITDDGAATSFCGSPAYLSPEMLKNKSVGKAADVYGIGTVLFEMLVGQSPYYSDDIPKMYQNIKKAKLTFPRYVSESAKALILKLLNRDPNERLGVKDRNELRNDPFFKGIDWDKVLKKEYKPPILEDIEEEDDDNDNVPSKIILNDNDYEERNKKINRVNNFTFIRNKPPA
jgi:serum/glucocorticoid-regulated kinase 2